MINWDRLIIRASKVAVGTHPYPLGYVYIDNVNICCCTPVLHGVTFDTTTVTVAWEGAGQVQAAGALGDSADWHNMDCPVEMDPETGEYRTRCARMPGNMFFRVVGPDEPNVECGECGAGN